MKVTMRDVSSLWMAGLTMIVLSAGCATSDGTMAQVQHPPAVTGLPVKPEQAPPAVEQTYYFHRIRWTGETLSIIAGWYTGDVQNWRALAEANPDIDPNKVHVGMKIRIPEKIMTIKTPMTKEHVDSFYSRAKKRTGKMPYARPKAAEDTADEGKTSETKAEEPALFGPKVYPGK